MTEGGGKVFRSFLRAFPAALWCVNFSTELGFYFLLRKSSLAYLDLGLRLAFPEDDVIDVVTPTT